MSRVIQIRDVPDDVHEALRAAAHDRGMSLTRFILVELEQVARRAQVARDNTAVVRRAQADVGAAVDRETILSVMREGRDEWLWFVVAMLVGDVDPEPFGQKELAVPHLLDTEVSNALRRLVLRGALSEQQGDAAIGARMWELRHNRTACDATYFALAEVTGTNALLTTDVRLAHAPGAACPVRVV